ncbi:MAG TPA: DNA-3-methyladenine glycosylase, partial [bacterium]|nr:DNA-3-methyladenine glycosylase [bacterium]
LAQLVEVEAYYLEDKASHASLGFTPKRRALFMPPGTVYMYYARGGDSFNISCRGDGNAVLLKAGVPYLGAPEAELALAAMQRNNPLPSGAWRHPLRLCAGQTLLCRALGLRVPAWDARLLPLPTLCLVDAGYRPRAILRTRRLGIPPGRDEHLPYRFVDAAHAASCTRNPLRRGARAGEDYQWCSAAQAGFARP